MWKSPTRPQLLSLQKTRVLIGGCALWMEMGERGDVEGLKGVEKKRTSEVKGRQGHEGRGMACRVGGGVRSSAVSQVVERSHATASVLAV